MCTSLRDTLGRHDGMTRRWEKRWESRKEAIVWAMFWWAQGGCCFGS